MQHYYLVFCKRIFILTAESVEYEYSSIDLANSASHREGVKVQLGKARMVKVQLGRARMVGVELGKARLVKVNGRQGW